MNQQSDNLICNVCQKSYSSVSAKNRHLRTVHHEAIEEKPRNTVHIRCPICNEQEKPSFGSHDLLISHLENNHSLSIKTSFYNFRTMEEFETWRALISRSVDYVVNSTHFTQSTNTKQIYYNCNRSNSRGFVSQCSQRSMKKGGSIRISGMCPSRICVKICGLEITVKFIETHVGHGDDLHAKHLTQSEQQEIAKKLIDGVTKERILQDSRAISDHQIERKNLLNCGDLAYIIRKFNIDKKRHDNDIHRFKCQCTEYTVKTALCKHIHAVALVEKGSDSVLGDEIEEEKEDSNLCISEPSTSRNRYEEDVKNFIVENEERQNPNVSTDQSRKQGITKERAHMLVNMLNHDNLDKITHMLVNTLNDDNLDKITHTLVNTLNDDNLDKMVRIMEKTVSEQTEGASTSKKRKIDKQSYYPSKK